MAHNGSGSDAGPLCYSRAATAAAAGVGNERRPSGPNRRQQQDSVLLVLRQEPARGPQADCGPERVHLRRMRRVVQRHHPRGTRGKGTVGAQLAAQAPRDPRSEEHTSELQSLMRISYSVFLLKKKKTHILN